MFGVALQVCNRKAGDEASAGKRREGGREAMGCFSSHHWWAVPVPALQRVEMSGGEIVELLPSLSPGLSHALLDFLQLWREHKGVGLPGGWGGEPRFSRFLRDVDKRFAAELKALVARSGAVQQDSRRVIRQLVMCLLFALAITLPHSCGIRLGPPFSRHYCDSEQALEVLYSALVSQHWSNAVRRLKIWSRETFGTERACEHLAHLLQSGHCKLQQLTMINTAKGGMRHIARALETNSSLTVLIIIYCGGVGDGGVEQLAAMLRTNSTLEELTLYDIGMTAHGLGHLCDALSTQQSLPATSSSPTGTMPNGHMGGLKKLDISKNYEIGQGGAALLGAMLANNRCLRTLGASNCNLRDEDGEGHLAKGLRENSTLEDLDISGQRMGSVAMGLLVRWLATNTSLKNLDIGNVREMPAAEELAHMIACNQSLLSLNLAGDPYDWMQWVNVIFPAIGRNKTLQSLVLAFGQVTDGVVSDLLRINTTLKRIDFGWMYVGDPRGPGYDRGKEWEHVIINR